MSLYVVGLLIPAQLRPPRHATIVYHVTGHLLRGGGICDLSTTTRDVVRQSYYTSVNVRQFTTATMIISQSDSEFY